MVSTMTPSGASCRPTRALRRMGKWPFRYYRVTKDDHRMWVGGLAVLGVGATLVGLAVKVFGAVLCAVGTLMVVYGAIGRRNILRHLDDEWAHVRALADADGLGEDLSLEERRGILDACGDSIVECLRRNKATKREMGQWAYWWREGVLREWDDHPDLDHCLNYLAGKVETVRDFIHRNRA